MGNKESILKNKETLLRNLKQYKKILSSNIYNYLLSLIELNDSALESKLSKEELESITIFKDISLYNIYNLANEYTRSHSNVSSDEQINNIKIYHTNFPKDYLLFDLYFDNYLDDELKQEVNFYNRINDQKHYEELDEKLSEELEQEYSCKNPYNTVHVKYGEPGSKWLFEHQEKIQKLEKQIQDIRGRDFPTEKDKELIEIIQEYNKSLFNYFKINEEGFSETKSYITTPNKKILVKEINGIKVYNNIRYM